MSLDSFKPSKPYKDGGDSIVTETCAIQASNELSDIIGEWPSEEQWNDNMWKIGVNTRYSDVLDKLDLSDDEFRLKANVLPHNVSGTDSYISRYKYFGDLYYAAAIFGPDFCDKHLKNHNALVETSSMKNRTGMTINEMKKYLPELIENQGECSKEQMENELNELVDKIGFPIKASDVNKHCSFSSGKVGKLSDDSRFTEGLKEINMHSIKQGGKKEISDSNTRRNVRKKLQSIDGYNSDSDAYVYHLLFESDEYGTFNYVGETSSNSLLVNRLSTHINNGGQTSEMVIIDGEVVNTSDIEFDVTICSIQSIKQEECAVNVNDRAKALENKVFKDLCSDSGIETTKVIGGK